MEIQTLLMILIGLHVLPGVFWVGSTFVLARLGGVGAEKFTIPQLIAAGVVFITGMSLWSQTHPLSAGFGPAEQVLATGAICALGAAGVQSLFVLPAVRTLVMAGGGTTGGAARTRIAVAESVAATLLAITVVCMVIARYV
jgi:hypothetical protein